MELPEPAQDEAGSEATEEAWTCATWTRCFEEAATPSW